MNYRKLFFFSTRSVLISLRFVFFNKEVAFILWALILIIRFANKKNHFISILLILEIFSILNILIIRVVIRSISIVRIIFILMAFRVGEAVLGLAILVKLVRCNYSELLSSSLNWMCSLTKT